jgi:hypothetical protein
MESTRLWRLAAACRLAVVLFFVARVSRQAVAADAPLHGAILQGV